MPSTRAIAPVASPYAAPTVVAIGWSAGTAIWRPDETFESCLSRADRTLYEAKSLRELPRQRVTGDVPADRPADDAPVRSRAPH